MKDMKLELQKRIMDPWEDFPDYSQEVIWDPEKGFTQARLDGTNLTPDKDFTSKEVNLYSSTKLIWDKEKSQIKILYYRHLPKTVDGEYIDDELSYVLQWTYVINTNTGKYKYKYSYISYEKGTQVIKKKKGTWDLSQGGKFLIFEGKHAAFRPKKTMEFLEKNKLSRIIFVDPNSIYNSAQLIDFIIDDYNAELKTSILTDGNINYFHNEDNDEVITYNQQEISYEPKISTGKVYPVRFYQEVSNSSWAIVELYNLRYGKYRKLRILYTLERDLSKISLPEYDEKEEL